MPKPARLRQPRSNEQQAPGGEGALGQERATKKGHKGGGPEPKRRPLGGLEAGSANAPVQEPQAGTGRTAKHAAATDAALQGQERQTERDRERLMQG